MPTLIDQRTALLEKANTVIATAKADNDRPLTDPETDEVKSLLDQVDAVDERLARVKRSDEVFERVFSLDRDTVHPVPGSSDAWADSKGRLSLAKAAPAAFTAMRKAPVAVGSTVVEVELVPGIVPGDRTALTLLDAIPAVRRQSPVYRYLRESVRTPNAAPVAPGAAKPVSTFTVASVDDRLRVIATVSEAVDRFILEDAVALRQFLEAELIDAVRRAIETQIITGDATGENFRGFNSISGTQTVTAATSLLAGLRSAQTKLQNVSIQPSFWAVNPTDLEKAQVTRNTSGNFDWSPEQPIGSGSLQAWGVPIIPTSAVPALTAWAVGDDSVTLSTDGAMRVDWGTPNDTFTKNQLVARAETRANLDALRPSGLVKITIVP